ncbi:DUF4139 domain-containing protein [Thermococcus sp. 9N3]|uniref:DUF4139 domain-containing protein n=1 Tax=Thermococcus sp. 9N3 TaxID=163002 RepID=UPI00142F8593|nr:DUF4139 domain-containing protein [Thermococcus sp. 9N3]NJE48917.1 DUF4139 domain-containing protein [Thermococcus sp. 9N3]
MRKRFFPLVVSLVVIVLVALSFQGEKASTSDVTVALYSSASVGIVERTLEVELKAGINEVPLKELSGLNLAEVSIRPLDDGVSVMGLFGSGESKVGSDVEVGLKNGEVIAGKYLGTRDGKIAVEGDGYYLINPNEVAYFKTKDLGGSSVYAVLRSEKAGKFRVSVTYRVSGISWESRYRLYIGDQAELRGYVVIKNPTDREFSDAKVLLVAGDVSFYSTYTQPRNLYEKAGDTSEVTVGSPEKVEAFYLYRLGVADIKAGSTMVYPYVELRAPFEREYLYESWAYGGERPVYESISFKTDKVLPAGTVEIFKETRDGELFIGESRIGHTPKGDTVRIGIGRDYELKGTTTVLERSNDGKHYKIRITLQNFGNETKTVIVRHHKWGKVTYASLQPLDETADYVEFSVTLKPGEKREITFEYGS